MSKIARQLPGVMTRCSSDVLSVIVADLVVHPPYRHRRGTVRSFVTFPEYAEPKREVVVIEALVHAHVNSGARSNL